MSATVLGTTVVGDRPVRLDVDRLLASRMLLQANSGGGKSYALRRLLEQTHGRVQHLVLDIEGEFHTLRERFDYVLAARTGGDTLADVRSAPLLARRLLELGVSAILDLYELKVHERVLFVRRFLEALVEAPRELWHPALVVVDEAHHFCPQVGSAESAAAVIDLMTRGRKRGYCGVLATQRLSKLHKDAAAEANVKLIGRASLDVDLRRAADELGLTAKEDLARIRNLPPGRFLGFGPGLSDQVVELQVGPVETTHPKAGRGAAPVPPPRKEVQKVLEQLKDLPKEAEQETQNLQQAKAEIARLKRELAAKPAPPATKVERVEVGVMTDGQVARIEKLWERAQAATSELHGAFAKLTYDLGKNWIRVGDSIQAARNRGALNGHGGRVDAPPPRAAVAAPLPPRAAAVADGALGRCERSILAVLAQSGGGAALAKIALLAGYRMNGGGFRNALGALRTAGLVEGGNGEEIRLTAAGEVATANVAPLPTGAALVEHWKAAFGLCERKVIDALLAAPDGLPIDEVAATAGYAVGGGGFRNALGALRTAGVLVGGNGQAMRLCDELLAAGGAR